MYYCLVIMGFIKYVYVIFLVELLIIYMQYSYLGYFILKNINEKNIFSCNRKCVIL